MNDRRSPHRLVLCTCPDREVGERLAQALVSERLAACVNVVHGLTSVYAWEGRIEKDAECLLLIKTRSDILDRIQQRLVELHPYELPEVIAVAIEGGLEGYLRWIDAAVDRGS